MNLKNMKYEISHMHTKCLRNLRIYRIYNDIKVSYYLEIKHLFIDIEVKRSGHEIKLGPFYQLIN